MKYVIKQINSKESYPFLLNIHYAKRIPSISYCYGLFEDEVLVGVCTYGTPPSSNLRNSLLKQYPNKLGVLELNRLCLLNNKPNEASRLVGASLRQLPKKYIIVSFADIDQGHIGTVYKATNFLYVGLSAKRTDWKVKGMEHKHGISIADEFRGKPNRGKLLREKYGDRFYLKERSRKHKYLFFT